MATEKAKSNKTEKKKEKEKKPNVALIVGICAVVVCVICVVVALCLKKGGEPKNPLIGSWKYSGMEAIYTFNEDKTCSYKYYSNERTCTYTDTGDTIELQYDGDTMSSTFKYHIEDGKVLHIEDSFGQEVLYNRQ